MKKLHINTPFVEVISQISKYAKYLKDILSNKKKLANFAFVGLNEECFVVSLRKLHLKLKDLGSFTISCMIGESYFENACVIQGLA